MLCNCVAHLILVVGLSYQLSTTIRCNFVLVYGRCQIRDDQTAMIRLGEMMTVGGAVIDIETMARHGS